MVQHFRSDGLLIAYETAGSGPPVILVHGFASSHRINWLETSWMEALAQAGFRAIALDCRGHGGSDKPRAAEAYRLAHHVHDLRALMDHLDLQRANLIGYSMGARIVLALLLEEPVRGEKVVVGGFGLPTRDPQFVERVARALEAPDASANADPVALRFRRFAERHGGDLVALAACFRGVVQEPFGLADLAAVTCPVLVVAGAKDDQIVRPEDLAAAIPGARLVTIPGRDHMTVVGDPRFKSAALDFFAA